MARENYRITSGKPAFSVDDDDMTAAFLQSSSAKYLAADRLPTVSSDSSKSAEQQQHKDHLIQRMMQTEQRTLQSSKRSLGLLAESEQVGVETSRDLLKQREQLSNAERRLEQIDVDLKDSQKNVSSIESVFSSLKQWFTSPKASSKDKKEGESNLKLPPEEKLPQTQDSALNKVLQTVSSTRQTQESGYQSHRPEDTIDDEHPADMTAFRSWLNRVDKKLDSDLDQMGAGLANLKGLAEGLGTEIEDQNTMIDRLNDRVDYTGANLNVTKKRVEKLLKR